MAINPLNRRYVRFVWIHDLSQPAVGNNIHIFQFKRVALASLFLLNAIITHHLKTNATHITDQLLRDIYVDNVITGCSTIDQACIFYNIAVHLFEQCSMNLRAWATNSGELRKKFLKQYSGVAEKISALGVQWNLYTDTLTIKKVEQLETITLRTILSTAASFFDPLGWFSPLTIETKILIRNIGNRSDA